MVKAKTDPADVPVETAIVAPDAVPAPPSVPIAEPAAVSERPRRGGSYIRQRDGSLVKREG